MTVLLNIVKAAAPRAVLAYIVGVALLWPRGDETYVESPADAPASQVRAPAFPARLLTLEPDDVLVRQELARLAEQDPKPGDLRARAIQRAAETMHDRLLDLREHLNRPGLTTADQRRLARALLAVSKRILDQRASSRQARLDARYLSAWFLESSLRDFPASRRAYAAFLEEFPDEPVSRRARQRLAELQRIAGTRQATLLAEYREAEDMVYRDREAGIARVEALLAPSRGTEIHGDVRRLLVALYSSDHVRRWEDAEAMLDAMQSDPEFDDVEYIVQRRSIVEKNLLRKRLAWGAKAALASAALLAMLALPLWRYSMRVLVTGVAVFLPWIVIAGALHWYYLAVVRDSENSGPVKHAHFVGAVKFLSVGMAVLALYGIGVVCRARRGKGRHPRLAALAPWTVPPVAMIVMLAVLCMWAHSFGYFNLVNL